MSEDLARYHGMGKAIEQFIRPSTFPLAVKVVQSETESVRGFRRPSTDLKLQNFVCQDFKMCRSYGWTVAITEEDVNCKIARAVYGWDPVTEEALEWMNAFSVGLYARDAQASGKFLHHLYRFENAVRGLVISPLSWSKVVPDVVLVYCLPAQAMRLVQGYLYCEGGVLESTAAGRVGSCHEGVAKTLLTGKPQLVLLGNGDRIWGGAQDSEVLFSCPAGKLGALIEGLEATHAAGLRYPIPAYMNFSPGFQEAFERQAVERAGGTILVEGKNTEL